MFYILIKEVDFAILTFCVTILEYFSNRVLQEDGMAKVSIGIANHRNGRHSALLQQLANDIVEDKRFLNSPTVHNIKVLSSIYDDQIRDAKTAEKRKNLEIDKCRFLDRNRGLFNKIKLTEELVSLTKKVQKHLSKEL